MRFQLVLNRAIARRRRVARWRNYGRAFYPPQCTSIMEYR